MQNGKKPTYEFHNNGNVTVYTGNTENNYNRQVIQIGENALPYYQLLAHLIDSKKLDKIEAGPCNQKPDIYLGKNDSNIFDIPTTIEEENIELQCEIFSFDKYQNIGKLSIKIKEQAIPLGEYSFTVMGSQDYANYIHSMLKSQVKLHCLREMKSNPFGEDKVHKLHITSVIL